MTIRFRRRDRPKRHTLRDVLDVLMFIAVVVIAVSMWPASLGGSTRAIVVEGHSMEPTFHFGEMVIVRTNPHPKVGAIIVYRIPKGDPAAGMMIIHRVTSVRPDGTYQTQGDNRTTPDPFDIASRDIVGSPILAIPHLGRLIGLTSSPLVLGAAAGMLTTFLLWPQRKQHRAALVPAAAPEIDFDRLAEEWLAEQLVVGTDAPAPSFEPIAV